MATHKTYPYYNGDFLDNFVDCEELVLYLKEYGFGKRFKHIQILAQELIAKESIEDFDEFIEIITNDKRFINNLVSYYVEHIYQYVANNYCNDSFLYENGYSQYDIEDTKELVRIIQLIAEYEEE